MTNKIAVLVSCGSAKEARKIARTLVEQRLVACGNVLRAPVQSIYRWKGKVEAANEFLLVLKTSRPRFHAVENAIRALHSYELPEIIALPITKGSREYLRWIAECLDAPKASPKSSRQKRT